MSQHLHREPRTGGFGLGTLLPFADGKMVPAVEVTPGSILEGNRVVTEVYRFWMREAVEFNGGVYSPVNALQWGGAFSKLVDLLDNDPNHRRLGPTQMVCLATSDHRIETPVGLMVDFWISEERRQQIQEMTIQSRPRRVND